MMRKGDLTRCASGADGSTPRTYWNGQPTPARRVRVRVGGNVPPSWWCAHLARTVREAVEVTYGGERFFLDNENGSGWAKVTIGRGWPQYGHSSLPSDSVVVDDGPAPEGAADA